jgi:UDP-N-acetylglucosamine 2-epimerase (non-hydrolysing)
VTESDHGFGVLTLHRPANVDEPMRLRRLVETLADLSQRLPLVFPVHPRTRSRIDSAGLWSVLQGAAVAVTPPLGYLQLLGLMREARLVLTDSGGIQEETTALGVPCVTLRDNTERPITVSAGTNTVVGADPARIREVFEDILATGGKAGRVPELWDGKAAERIAAVIDHWASSRRLAAA